MLIARWTFFLQLCLFRLVEGTLKGATVTSHVRSHSCTWSPGDMGTFLHPSRMGPARMSLGLSDLAVCRNDVPFLRARRATCLGDLCGKEWESHHPRGVPSQQGHFTQQDPTAKPQIPGVPPGIQCFHMPSMHFGCSLQQRATALENLQPLLNNAL